MAYQGGIYTQPIATKAEKIAQFYLDGQMNVNKIKLQVQEARTKELSELAKASATIQATGAGELDKLYAGGARSLTEAAYAAHQANREGKISRSEATALISSYQSQANQLGNISDLVAKKLKAYDEAIAADKQDEYGRNKYIRTLIKDRPMPRYLINEKGERIPYQDTVQVGMIGNDASMIRNFQYADQSGKIQTATQTRRLTDIAGGKDDVYLKFDPNERVKDFLKVLGQNYAFPYNQTQDLGGQIMFQAVLQNRKVPELRNNIENELDSIVADDKDVVRIITQHFGGKAIGDPGHKWMTQEDLKKIYGTRKFVNENGDEEEIPQFYNDKGELLVPEMKNGLIIDPTTIQLDDQGEEIITDQQRELAKAFMRDKFLQGLDVNYREYWSNNGSGSTPPGIPVFNASVMQTSVPEISLGPGAPTASTIGKFNKSAIQNDLILAIDAAGKARNAANDSFENNRTINQNGQQIESTNYNDSLKNNVLYNQMDNLAGAVTFRSEQGTLKKGGAPSRKDILLNNIDDVTTIHDRTLNEVTGILYFDEGFGRNGKASPAAVYIKGTSDFGKAGSEVAAMVGSSQLGLTEERTIQTTDYIRIPIDQMPQLYANFWNNNVGGFRDYLVQEGYKADGSNEDGQANQWISAFKDYSESFYLN
jgi:hypothetical protein